MEIYIVVGLMGGLIEDITAYRNPKDADQYEAELCEKYELPVDRQERHDYPSDDQVTSFKVTLQ